MTTGLDKLERRFGRYAISNLTLWLVIGQAIVWLLGMLQIFPVANFLLVPQLVLGGEVWRVVSFIFVPPFTSGPLWTLLGFYVLYLYGSALENIWGTFRYNCFVLLGIVLTAVLTVLGTLLLPQGWLGAPFVPGSFLLTTIFIAFAILNPNMHLLLFFVLPMRVKWLGWLAFAFLAFLLLAGPVLFKLAIFAALLNLFLFFGPEFLRSRKMQRRADAFRAEQRAVAAEPFHRCVVCDITDQQDPDLRFAYKDGKGYCERHWDQMDAPENRAE